MKLYLLGGSLEDGNRLDHIISAETPKQALEFWRDIYDEFLDPSHYNTLLEGVDLDYTNAGYDEVVRVFEITPTGLGGALGWRSVHGNTRGLPAGVTLLVAHTYPT